MSKRIIAMLGGGLLLISFVMPGSATAQSFDTFQAFGDSLSDAGTYNFPVNGVATPMMFTVNPGPVWTQLLGSKYGIDVSPNLAIDLSTGATPVVNGSDFAQGGACVNSGFGPHCPIFPANSLGETQQIATYLASTGGTPIPMHSIRCGAAPMTCLHKPF